MVLGLFRMQGSTSAGESSHGGLSAGRLTVDLSMCILLMLLPLLLSMLLLAPLFCSSQCVCVCVCVCVCACAFHPASQWLCWTAVFEDGAFATPYRLFSAVFGVLCFICPFWS